MQTEIRPEIDTALQQLMSKRKLTRQQAEQAFLAGVAKIAELGGSPVPPRKLTIAHASKMIDSGEYAELETKARAKADRMLASMGVTKPAVAFERARPKNKFI